MDKDRGQIVRTTIISVVTGAGLLLGGLALGQGVGPGQLFNTMPGQNLGRAGMMGQSYGAPSEQRRLRGVEPLTASEADTVLDEWLGSLPSADLEVGEIMIFDNHAYAQIVEETTGIGAFEVLVDPVTHEVYPEHGATMMWNTKYGGLGMSAGRFGMSATAGGMGAARIGTELAPFARTTTTTTQMPITPQHAVAAAQRYLDEAMPGAIADEHADRFYGYYTLHLLRDNEVIGMLSVNGYTAAVLVHWWHGELIETAGDGGANH